MAHKIEPMRSVAILLARSLLALPLLALPLLVLSLPAQAQERTPAQRQTLADIAYVLGESHALRQVCEGAYDQFWRDQMIGVTDTEAPDAALDRRLKEAFNSGFASRRAEFPECSRASRLAEAAAARRGQALAAGLAAVRHRVDPREAEARRQAEQMEQMEQLEADLSLRP